MIKEYYLNGERVSKPYDVIINGFHVYSPSDTQIEQAGYEIREIIDPIPEPILPTYAELVEQYIREHGYPTYGAELAILNNYAQDPMTYADAYAAYMQTRTDAKNWAESEPHREDDV